jgi:hypothetical protein
MPKSGLKQVCISKRTHRRLRKLADEKGMKIGRTADALLEGALEMRDSDLATSEPGAVRAGR